MTREAPSRRRFLRTGLVVSSVLTAGCGSNSDGDSISDSTASESITGSSNEDTRCVTHPGIPTSVPLSGRTLPLGRDIVSGSPPSLPESPYRPTGEWPLGRGDIANTGFRPNPISVSETADPLWRFDSTPIADSPPGTTVLDKIAYFGAGGDSVYALDAGTGKLRWRFRMEDSLTAGGPNVSTEALFANSQYEDGTLYVLDPKTGELRWRRNFSTRTVHTPMVDGETTYIAHDTLLALSTDTGDEQWRFSFPAYWSGEQISLSGDRIVTSVKNVSEDRSGVYVFNRQGESEWHRTEGINVFENPPVVSNETVYISNNSEIYARRLADGTRLWRFQPPNPPGTGDPLLSPPALAHERIVFSNGTHIFALSATTGEVLWREPGHRSPIVADETVYFVQDGGDVVGADLDTGTINWRLDTGLTGIVDVTFLDGMLFIHHHIDKQPVLTAFR